jgi:MFS family permease
MTATASASLGPIRLQPAVSRLNTIALIYGNFITIGGLVFVSIGQAYVLNANLGVPRSEQGVISGDLALWSELIIVLTIGLFGVMADRTSRRLVFAFGLAMLALSYVLYPLAGAVGDLVVYRALNAIGVAATTCLLTVITHDYAREESRGKLLAACAVGGGLGALLITGVFGRLPVFFKAQGLEAVAAGRYTHWLVAILIGLSAVFLVRALKSGTPTHRKERPSFRELIHSGVREARNPRIALSYASAFVARGDLMIVGTFLVLWGTIAGLEQGMSTPQAVAAGTMLFVITQIATLAWIPVLGMIMDRLNRVTAVIVGSALGATAFLSTAVIDNPLDRAYVPVFVLIGIGQISCLLTSQALIGQEAPARKRGAVVGAFSWCGAIGIMASAAIGGRLFDTISPAAPFILVGGGTVAVMLMGIAVRLKSPGRMPARTGKRLDAQTWPGQS